MKTALLPLLRLLTFAVAALVLASSTFADSDKEIQEKREKIRKGRDEILAKLYKEHPEAKEKMQKAVGYGAFNNKNIALVVIAAGGGSGLVVDNATGKETFMSMGTVGAGLGIGAKDMSVVFIFKKAETMKKFVESGWQFGAEADAAAKSGEDGGAAAMEGGMDMGGNFFEIYQITDAGISLQATVAGTKYWKNDDLNK